MTNDILHQHINQRGSQTALVDAFGRSGFGRSVSWTQLGELVDDQTRQWAQKDLSQPIIHRSENTIYDVVKALAAACMGAIEAPLDHRISPEEVDRRTRLLRSGSPEGGVPPGVILWTSGTTDRPRGVLLSHQSWLSNAAAKLKAVPQVAQDVRLTVLPLSHSYARTCDLGTWLLSGCTLAVTLGMKGLNRTAPTLRPTLINTVPSMAYELLQKDLLSVGLDRLQLLGVGGAPLSRQAFQAWKQRGVTVIQGYGLTESGPVICSATPGNATAGLVGHLVDQWQHQIRDGQLWVRGPHLMHGYWQNSMATQDGLDAQGWLATGDFVEWDSSTGQLRVLGRADDVMVFDNGVKIHPSTIERDVQQIAGVDHAMLVQRQELELWIDGKEILEQAVRQAMGTQAKFIPVSIHFFETPLSQADGELTEKGTIRRNQILQRRF